MKKNMDDEAPQKIYKIFIRDYTQMPTGLYFEGNYILKEKNEETKEVILKEIEGEDFFKSSL